MSAAAWAASRLGARPPLSTRRMIGHTATVRRSWVAARFMIETSLFSCMPFEKPV